jgi:hypothetical protein
MCRSLLQTELSNKERRKKQVEIHELMPKVVNKLVTFFSMISLRAVATIVYNNFPPTAVLLMMNFKYFIF